MRRVGFFATRFVPVLALPVFFVSVLLAIASSASQPKTAIADNAKCLMCHSASGFQKATADGIEISLHVNQRRFADSIHGNLACTDCHSDLKTQSFPHRPEVDSVDCGRCHYVGNGVGAPNTSPQAQHLDSIHGKAAAKGNPDAPTCSTCHGRHYIRPITDPDSVVHRTNVPATCAQCHNGRQVIAQGGDQKLEPLESYLLSIHGRVVMQNAETKAAVCTDCHGVHDIRSKDDPLSGISKYEIPSTCGKCHDAILREYETGVHGKAVRQGNPDAPVCVDCHGEHAILERSDPQSHIYPGHIQHTCSKCHDDERIQGSYGLPGERLGTYRRSYHGVANRFGNLVAPNCVSCHNAHEIRPSSDPKSVVHPANLAATCGKCHKGATENFARGKVHVMIDKDEEPSLYYIATGFKWFTALIMTALVSHIGLDLLARRRSRRAIERNDSMNVDANREDG